MKDNITEKERIERYIMAWLLTDYDNLIDFMRIQPSDLERPYNEILKIMKSEWTWDIPLICSKSNNLKSDDLYELASEVIYTNPLDFQKYVEALKDIVDRERITQILQNSALNVKGFGSMWEIYLSIHREFMKLEEFNWDSVKDDLKDVINEAHWEKEVKIIPTWYRDLDNLIWWFEWWQIVVAWARPWIWKSMIAINLMMNNVRMWEKVALFSMEMMNKQIIRRLLALTSWVSVWKLKTKLEWAELDRVNKWYEELKQRLDNMYLIDNCWTIGEIEWKIRYLVHKEWVSIVYIDYLQLIRNPQIKNNPVESITDISQRLKQLALQLWITIVELSQLNRDADKTIIKKASQLRGSGSIEQDADMVWILDKENDEWKEIELSVQKCRDGRIGDIQLMQNADIMQITNKPKPF
jgi:replicative DNA helicase